MADEKQFNDWIKLREESIDEHNEKLFYCGHTNKCSCSNPDIELFNDATPEERPVIIMEVRLLIADLKRVAFRAKELEWYMSGDTGATTYLERLRNEK